MSEEKALITFSVGGLDISLFVAEQDHKLFMALERNGGHLPTLEQILLAFSEKVPQVVKEFLDLGVMQEALKTASKEKKVARRRIAKGIDAEPGRDGKVLLLLKPFDPETRRESDENPDQKISFQALHLFDNVKKGQVIGRTYPPHGGRSGKTVLGVEVPAQPGKVLAFSLKEGCESRRHSGGYEEIVATTDGYIGQRGSDLGVYHQMTIKEDLTLKYGSIAFIGRLAVQGSVGKGVALDGKNFLKVDGDSNEAVFTSSAGSVQLHGFVFGGAGRVRAARDLEATVLQKVDAEAGRNLFLLKEATDCTLRAREYIFAKSARFRGGIAWLNKGAEFQEIGAEAQMTTSIFFGSALEVSQEFTNLLETIENHERAQTLLVAHLGPYAENQTRVALLHEPLKGKITTMYQKLQQVRASLLTFKKKRDEVRAKAQPEPSRRLNAHKIFPGVVLVCGETHWTIKESIDKAVSIRYNEEKKEFVVTDYEALPEIQFAPEENKE